MRDFFGSSAVTKLWGSTRAADVSWLCLNTIPEAEDGNGGDSPKNTKNNTAAAGGDNESTTNGRTPKSSSSKTTKSSKKKAAAEVWGPTHSVSSEEEEQSSGRFAEEKKAEIDLVVRTTMSTPVSTTKNISTSASPSTKGTASTAKSSPDMHLDPRMILDNSEEEPMETIPCTLGRVWNNLQCLEDRTLKEVAMEEKKEEHPHEAEDSESQTVSGQQQHKIFDLFDEMCSPCKPKNLDDEFSHQYDEEEEPSLGISRLAPPNSCMPSSMRSLYSNKRHFGRRTQTHQSDDRSMTTTETPADRRRNRYRKRQMEATTNSLNAAEGGISPPGGGGDTSTTQEAYEVTPDEVLLVQKDPNCSRSAAATNNLPMPVESLELNKETAVELERCISELTMRSSYGEATAKIAESRRMAYYAVGKHHRQSGRGGNRRCYFTGKLILGGAPFYAGSVQQGLRTLVVFCLPSAVGLPLDMESNSSPSTRTPLGSISSHRRPSLSSRSNASVAHSRGYPRSTTGSLLSRKGSKLSRLSSVDDTSFEEELDPNWELDKEYLLSVLPEPNQDLLDEMAERYPAQFETLPVQVRSPPCWKLYVKFCFFSGLPIAEGEMHYQVIDSLANQYGEEIILSHEVMEAVNGDSAEILRLPNLKTFRYLRKHYHQQSVKLPDSCFQRQAWEMVRPEV